MPDIGVGLIAILDEEFKYLQRKKLVPELESVRLKVCCLADRLSVVALIPLSTSEYPVLCRAGQVQGRPAAYNPARAQSMPRRLYRRQCGQCGQLTGIVRTILASERRDQRANKGYGECSDFLNYYEKPRYTLARRSI
jgi:hypothetical protein